MRSHSGQCIDYCYMIGRGPSSCSLAHVTGLLFCFYKKLFLPSIFKFLNLWRITSCNVEHFELADRTFIKELEVFIDWVFQAYAFCPLTRKKSKIQIFWCTGNLHKIVWNTGCLDYRGLPNYVSRDVEKLFLKKVTEMQDSWPFNG